MANYSVLKAAVQAVVKTNGNQEITGANMQSTLISIINSLGTGYQFMGVATPSTSPGTPDYNVAYIGGAGTYANFGTSVTVPVGSICVFKYNGSWVKEQIAVNGDIDLEEIVASIEDINAEIKSINDVLVHGKRINLFDKEQEYRLGYIGSNGDFARNSTGDYLCTYNIPIKKNTWYTIGCPTVTDNLSNLLIGARNGDNNTGVSFTIKYGTTGETSVTQSPYTSSTRNPIQFKVDNENPYIAFAVKFATEDARDTLVLIEGEIADYPTEYVPYRLFIAAENIDPELIDTINGKASYSVETSKNMINPAEVQIGKYIGYNSSGIVGTAPSNLSGSACSGLIPVQAGETYYLTRGSASAPSSIFTFIQADKSHTTTPLNPLTNLPCTISEIDNKSLAVKAPSDAVYALICLSISGWTDTETQIEGFQFEKGSVPTEYEPYKEPRLVITEEHLPQEIIDLPQEIEEIVGEKNNLFMYRSDKMVMSYIESEFDATHNLRQNFYIKRRQDQAGGKSQCFNYQSIMIIEKATGNSVSVDDVQDDICPANFNNGGYVGANHGYDKFYKVTSASHGKTYADIGSVYSNSGNNYVVLDIVDDNNLIIGGESTSTYPIWNTIPSAGTGSYSHVSGGTHTGSFSVTSSVVAQGKPVEKLDETHIVVDGKEITNDGVYYFGKEVIITQNYKIANYQSILNILKANVGSYTGHPIYSELQGVDYCVKLSISYIFTDAAHNFVAQSLSYLQDQKLGYFGFMQKAPLTSDSSTRLYIPKALPVINGDDLDFRTNPIFTSSTFTTTTYLSSSYWENPNFPPDRFMLSDNSIAFLGGYMFDYGVGGNRRKDFVEDSLFIATSRKVYPEGIDDAKVGVDQTAGNSYSAMCFRIYKPLSEINQSGVRASNFFELNGYYYLYIDFSSTGLYEFSIPNEYIGKKIETFEKSNNVSLMGEIASNTILFQVTSAAPMYGYFVGKIKK